MESTPPTKIPACRALQIETSERQIHPMMNPTTDSNFADE
jgi:hypothetical protein